MNSSLAIEKLGIPLPPVVGNGMVRSRQRRTGEKVGGRNGFGLAAACPPPIFSPFVPTDGAHHSAANAVGERNLKRIVADGFKEEGPSCGLVLEARNLNNPTPSATEWSAVWGVRTVCGSACRRHATVCRPGSSVPPARRQSAASASPTLQCGVTEMTCLRHAWWKSMWTALNCQEKTLVISNFIS